MVRLDAFEALPADFAQLEHLEIVIALMMPSLKTFPDLTRSSQALKALVIDPCPLCCDGFLQTECDLSSDTCGHGDFPNNACLHAGLSATTEMLKLSRL